MAKFIPYDFVFDYLPLTVRVKQLFGMHYIYMDKKLMLILRKAKSNINLNGIWLATSKEHHKSLQKDIPSLSDFILDNGDLHDSGWRFLKEDDDDFETAAIRICELIAHGDKRIGKETKGSATL
jgi:hypothetical protein